jgi:hypothetical protein
VPFGQSLQRTSRVGDEQEVASGKSSKVGRQRFNYKVMNPSAVELANILVSIVTSRAQCEKQGFLRETQRTAIGEQKADASILIAISVSADENRYLFNSVGHIDLRLYNLRFYENPLQRC